MNNQLKQDEPSPISSTLTTAADALVHMEKSRRDFVADQYEQLCKNIQQSLEESCEEYRENGKSKGIQVHIDNTTLAIENRKALEKAGYTLEPDSEDENYSWICANIPEIK